MSSAVCPPPSHAACWARSGASPSTADRPPRAGAPRRAGERLAERPERLQVVGQVARGEHGHARRRRAQQVLEVEHVEPARPERDRLPAVVGRSGRALLRIRAAAATNVPRPGPGVDEAARREQVDRALHGHRPGAVPAHQLAHGREPVAGPARGHGGLQLFQNGAHRVIVEHERGR